MITTFYSKHELENLISVSDIELNNLFQELRIIDNRYYLVECKVKIYNGFFLKDTEKILYMCLLCNNYECQVINFCQDHEGSFNTYVTKSYIYTYFLGIINGYNKSKN